MVAPGGSVGVDGRPRWYSGAAAPEFELLVASDIQKMFSRLTPTLSGVGGWLRNIRLADITVEVELAPWAVDAVTRTSTFIAIGSPAYNSAAGRVSAGFTGPAHIESDGTIEVPQLGRVGEPEYGLLERVKDTTTGQVAFYAGGRSVAATTAAARYLIDRWPALGKRYRDAEFCVLVRAADDGWYREVVYQTAQGVGREHSGGRGWATTAKE